MEQVDWGVRVRVGSHGVPMAPQRLLYLCSESSAVNWFVNFGHPLDGFAAGEWYSIFFLLYRCVLGFAVLWLRYVAIYFWVSKSGFHPQHHI